MNTGPRMYCTEEINRPSSLPDVLPPKLKISVQTIHNDLIYIYDQQAIQFYQSTKLNQL